MPMVRLSILFEVFVDIKDPSEFWTFCLAFLFLIAWTNVAIPAPTAATPRTIPLNIAAESAKGCIGALWNGIGFNKLLLPVSTFESDLFADFSASLSNEGSCTIGSLGASPLACWAI